MGTDAGASWAEWVQPLVAVLQEDMATRILQIDMHPEEDSWMMAVGAARSQQPAVHSCQLKLSPRICAEVVAENLKLLFIFDSLRHLQLRLDSDDVVVTQPMVWAIAELLHLTSLHILHGSLQPAVDISYWSSLRNLAELKLLPCDHAALQDQQLQQLTMLGSSLTSLSLRLDHYHVTAAGRQPLTRLTNLRQLSLCPMGQECTAEELQSLMELPQLSDIALGTTQASDVLLFSHVQLPASPPKLSLCVLDSCQARLTADVLSVMSWCLPQYLVRLTVGPLTAACPGDVLLLLATLTRLQELKLQLTSPVNEHTAGTMDLLALKPLQHLTCLELLTSTRLYVPVTVKTVSLLSVAWPQLASLTLSVAGKAEVVPEALGLLDNFKCLTALQLLSPLSDAFMHQGHAAIATTSANTGQGFITGTNGSWSWTDWALSGLQGLGLIRSDSSTTGGTESPSTLADAPANSHGGEAAARMPAATPSTVHYYVPGSPLSRDVRQRSLLQQQQQEHGKQHSRISASLCAPSADPAAVAARHIGRSLSLDVAGRARIVFNMFGACQGMYASSHPLHTALSMPEQRHSNNSPFKATVASEQSEAAAECAAPAGLDKAMYRGRSKLAVMNLQYLPRSLQRLCLESCHVRSGEVACRQQQNQQAVPSDTPNSSSGKALVTASPSVNSGSQGQQICHLEANTLQQPGNSSCDADSCSRTDSVSTPFDSKLSNLTHLELEDCCIHDTEFTAMVMASFDLRALEIADVEGLTDEGLRSLTDSSQLTRLVINAEESCSITLNSFSTISQLTTLETLHWCSRDSVHGPLDADGLAAQLCALTGLRQLALVSHQEQLAPGGAVERLLLRRLPLCRVLFRPQLKVETSCGDVQDPR